MILGLSGLEYVAIFAGESRSPGKSIGQSVIFATPVICAMFILGTASTAGFCSDRGKINPSSLLFLQTFRWALGNQGLGKALLPLGQFWLLQVRLLGVVSLVFSAVTRLPLTAEAGTICFPNGSPAWTHAPTTPVNSIFATAGLHFCAADSRQRRRACPRGFSGRSRTPPAIHHVVACLAMFAIPLGREPGQCAKSLPSEAQMDFPARILRHHLWPPDRGLVRLSLSSIRQGMP